MVGLLKKGYLVVLPVIHWSARATIIPFMCLPPGGRGREREGEERKGKGNKEEGEGEERKGKGKETCWKYPPSSVYIAAAPCSSQLTS